MFDWNHDGKKDWHDDYIYHELIKPKHSNNTENKHVSSNDPSIGCLFFVIIAVLLMFSK